MSDPRQALSRLRAAAESGELRTLCRRYGADQVGTITADRLVARAVPLAHAGFRRYVTEVARFIATQPPG